MPLSNAPKRFMAERMIEVTLCWSLGPRHVHELRLKVPIGSYRPLKVDPKVARRQRFKRQGKGRTGLFANRKSGSAAGY